MNNKEIQKVTLTSILVAVAVVLNFMIKFIPGLNIGFPEGGAVFGFYILPIVIIGLIIGPYYGLIGGIILGLVNFLIDGYAFHWGSIFFDYLLAFGSIGLISGLFKGGLKSIKKIIFAVLLAGLARYIFHGLSGVIFFAEYAGNSNVWLYSFVLYNLPYNASSTIITLFLTIAVRKNLLELEETLISI